jgi:P-type Cu+ transporter
MLVRDRVCGMEMDEADVKDFLVHEGRTYFFCSSGCRAEFERHADEYAEAARPEGEEGRDV